MARVGRSGDRVVITARVLGTPAPGLAVWRSTDDPEVAGDLEDAPEEVRTDDLLVLEVRREGFRWLVVDVVDHVPTTGGSPPSSSPAGRARGRPRRPHAHPARPPGTVLIAWLPFTREESDAPGKHRPCVVVHSSDPAIIRARPLYDQGSTHVRRHGGERLQVWRVAGLDKPSVAADVVDIPVSRCEQTIGSLAPVDRRRLGIS